MTRAIPSKLPEMPAWHARSFWLTLLTVAVPILNVSGIDLLGFLGAETINQAVDVIMIFLPLVTALWAWLERRTPNFQLVFRSVKSITSGFQ